MKKFLLLTTVALLMLATFVYAHEEESEFNEFLGIDTEELSEEETIEAQKSAVLENTGKVSSEINNALENMPGILNSIIGDVNVNVYFESEEILGVTFIDGKISAMEVGEKEDPTFNVYISDAVFVYLNTNSFDLKTALEIKDITYEGLGFFGTMKSALLTTALTLIGM